MSGSEHSEEDQPAVHRSPPFDPTDRELFGVQSQQLDWQLLQNGFVHRYDDRFSLDTACGHFAELGYLVHALDASTWTDVSDMHTALAAAMSFPDYYGRNVDALDDVLNDVAEYSYGSDSSTAGTVLAVRGFAALLQIDRRTAIIVLDVFARNARLAALFGHRMLCLIETADNGLGPVGGIDVLRQTVSEFPPDPPAPFDDTMLIEFGFQIYATPDEAERYVAQMRTVASPVLAAVGQYEFRPPQLTSTQSGQDDEVHSSSHRRREPGQFLYDIDFAVRGRGDRNELGDNVFHAVTSAKLQFEQMHESFLTDTYLEDALEKYPSLRNRD